MPAGVGWATLRSIVKLWFGASPDSIGVYSAGNGPAMRSTVLGACAGNKMTRLCVLVRAATRLTHTDPRAEEGARIVAISANTALARHGDPDVGAVLQDLLRHIDGEELRAALELARTCIGEQADHQLSPQGLACTAASAGM